MVLACSGMAHFLAAASICIGEILPTEFLNQWVTDSQVGRFSFHFLQCRARGANLKFLDFTLSD